VRVREGIHNFAGPSYPKKGELEAGGRRQEKLGKFK
jgi:hypothetical protein